MLEKCKLVSTHVDQVTCKDNHDVQFYRRKMARNS